MIRVWKMAACVALSLAAVGSTGVEAADAPSGDWVQLFDGKTLNGWTPVPLNKQPSHWEVKDGVIEGTGSQSMLYTVRGDYKNFIFRAEIKINDKGNSGMYVRVPTPEATFTKGYEIQVNSTHTDPVRTGSLYTLVNLYDSSSPPPPDTFFTQQIEVEDVEYRGKVVTRFRISVDGKLLYEYLDHDKLFEKGHFAFQQHDPGSRVSIRKVEVKELPTKDAKK